MDWYASDNGGLTPLFATGRSASMGFCQPKTKAGPNPPENPWSRNIDATAIAATMTPILSFHRARLKPSYQIARPRPPNGQHAVSAVPTNVSSSAILLPTHTSRNRQTNTPTIFRTPLHRMPVGCGSGAAVGEVSGSLTLNDAFYTGQSNAFRISSALFSNNACHSAAIRQSLSSWAPPIFFSCSAVGQ